MLSHHLLTVNKEIVICSLLLQGILLFSFKSSTFNLDYVGLILCNLPYKTEFNQCTIIHYSCGSYTLVCLDSIKLKMSSWTTLLNHCVPRGH